MTSKTSASSRTVRAKSRDIATLMIVSFFGSRGGDHPSNAQACNCLERGWAKSQRTQTVTATEIVKRWHQVQAQSSQQEQLHSLTLEDERSLLVEAHAEGEVASTSSNGQHAANV